MVIKQSDTPILLFDGGRLTPFDESFLSETYVSWLNDIDVVRFSELRHSRHDMESCRVYLERIRSENHLFWAILSDDKASKHIGNITAYIDQKNMTANVAIMIGDKTSRGKGYGLKAWGSACDWLLDKGRLRKIVAGTMSINYPMLSLMENSGMTQEGVLTDFFMINESFVDLILMAKNTNK